MKIKLHKCGLAFLLGATSLLSGCVVTSVAPYYMTKDVVFEPALVGDWRNEPEDQWKFEKSGTNAYRLAYSSGGKTALMQAHLFKLNGQFFLDLFSGEQNDESQPPPIPSHLLLRVYQFAPTVRMAPLDHDWLKDLLGKQPKALRHHMVQANDKPEDVRVVLTAETTELQRFLVKHLNTEAAWKGEFELKRQSAAAQAGPPVRN